MIKRRITQLLSLLMLHSSWGPELKWFCNPVLSCHSCVLSWFACPVGVFVHYSGYHVFPFLALGTVLLIGVLFGRLLCGWVCPFGFLQDILHRIPTRKFTLPRWTGSIKYAVLIFMVLLIPFFLGSETMYSFCRICPASALQVTIPGLVSTGFKDISLSMAVKLTVLAVVLVLVIFSSRAFCKTLCPIGALLAPLNFISVWTVSVPTETCLSCKRCDKACPTDVTPSERIAEGIAPNRSPDCIVCHECQSACTITADKKSG
ncbi:4Fe-4S binding protein [bacterium]|nr:4Fe-4S binding protein [bacterium]